MTANMMTLEARGNQPLDPRVHKCILAQFKMGPLPEGMGESDFYDRVDELFEIVAACDYAHKPQLATTFARQGLTLAEVRRTLFDMLADADEATIIDTARRVPTNESAADIWAARRSPASLGAELQGVWKARAEGSDAP